MEPNHDRMIARYVYAVVRRLPVEQREDVSLELKSLIEEMVRDRQDLEDPVRAVLLEMGNPSDLADRYRGQERHLIGPRYYDLYLLILKIVGFAVSLGLLISLAIGFAIKAPGSFGDALGQIVGTLFSAYAQAFAWITVTFVIMERFQVRQQGKEDPFAWDVDDLPEVPEHSTLIRRSEPIVSLVFLVIFFAVLNALPWFVRISGLDAKTVIINPFLPEVFTRTLWLFNTTIVIAMCIEFAKLYSGVQTRRLAALTVLLKLLSLGISLYIILGSGIWNPDFALELGSFAQKDFGPSSFIGRAWARVPVILAILMVLGYVVETLETLLRAWNIHPIEKIRNL